jgi:ribosomal protein L32
VDKQSYKPKKKKKASSCDFAQEMSEECSKCGAIEVSHMVTVVCILADPYSVQARSKPAIDNVLGTA